MAAMDTSDAQRNITRNVRILMAAREMYEQRQLAEALSWPSAKMTKTFKGDRRWSVEDLVEVAGVFGIAPGALLGSSTEIVGAAGPTQAAVNGSGIHGYFTQKRDSVTALAQVIDLDQRRKGVTPSDAPNRTMVRDVG